MNSNIRPIPFEEVNFVESSVEETVARLIRYAVDLPASDLFVCFEENDVAILVRHLGLMRLVTKVSHDQGRRIINHAKAMSGMDLAQRMRPLDGRWVCNLDNGDKLDLRVNTIPTMYGEDLCARLLKRNTELLELENLGLQHKSLVDLKGMLGNPSGLILVTAQPALARPPRYTPV